MPPEQDPGSRIRFARTASGDELRSLIHESAEASLLALLENPNLNETHVTELLERLDLPPAVLSAVAEKGKWASSEAIRMRLARHPKTPKRTAFSIVRQLYLLDLVRLSLLPSAPAEVRRVAEEVLITRIPHLPVGQKLTLARRGPSRVAGAIIAEGHPQALRLALANPFLAESQVLKVLSKPGIAERIVRSIAEHSKWSCQYNVRMALVRNQHTPVSRVAEYLPNIALRDLKEIAEMEGLAPHLKKIIQQDLARRNALSQQSET